MAILSRNMITTLTQSFTDFDFRLNRENFIRLLRPFASTLPTFYLLLVIPFALLGYVVLLAFPVLTIWFYFQMIGSLHAATGFHTWTNLLLPGSLMLITAVFSGSLMRIRFSNPAGIEVSYNKTPALSVLIHELVTQYSSPRLSKILLTRDDNVKVIRTPLSWFPIRSRNTLQIGLPVLLCSSPIQFKGILAREIARLSSQHNPVTGWLLNLQGQWATYHHFLERSHDFLLKPLALFFRYYSPVYDAISFYAARRAEISADRYILEIMEDDDAIKSIIRKIIFQHFLKEKYWPRVNSQPRTGKQKLFLPYKKMGTTVRENIRKEDVRRWIEKELTSNGDPGTTIPSLKTRLWMLGHANPIYPPALKLSAAKKYLSSSVIDMLVSSFDKSWARREGYTLEN